MRLSDSVRISDVIESPAATGRSRDPRGAVARRQHRAAAAAADTDRVLEAAYGHATREIVRQLKRTTTAVSLWRIRYAREGLDGLEDRLRSGTPPIYDEATNQRIRKVLDQPPPKGFVRWNGPLIARALGDVDVQYVWRSLPKQKHRRETQKIDLAGRKSRCESNDPDFAAKAADLVGLYPAPRRDCPARR
jgi:transposase